jgi:hypothetical protein
VAELKNLPEVLAKLKASGKLAEAGALEGVRALAVEFEGRVKRNLFQVQNNGVFHIGQTGDFPNRRTGNLANSFQREIREGFGDYSASVFPTAVYSRVLELGGGTNWRGEPWGSEVKYPYMSPTYEQIRPDADRIFTNAVLRSWKV